MKKRVLSVVMAFAMLTASFTGSLKFENLNRLTNLVTVSAAEQTETIKTSFNKKLLFADDAAFQTEIGRIRDELLPKYEKAAQKFDTIDDVVNWLSLYNESGYALGPVTLYAVSGLYLDGSDSLALKQYNSTMILSDEFEELSVAAINNLKEKNETFLNDLLLDERVEPWDDMLYAIINSNSFSEYENYLLKPAQRANNSYSDIYNTLIGTDLIYETVIAPDGSKVEANPVNCYNAFNDTKHPEYRDKMLAAYYRSFKNYENTFAALYNNFVVSSESLARIYGYSSVLQMSAIDDGISPDILLNLIKSAQENIGILNRYSSISNIATGYAADSFEFDNAQEILTKAFEPLGDEYITVLNKAFDEGWIDVYPADNKMSGGATVGFPGTVPCVIINYTDNYSSLTELAHEVGHAIHYYMSDSSQSTYSDALPTNFTAEIASLTNEILLARYMQNNAQTDEERLYYLYQELSIYDVNFFNTLYDTEFEFEVRNIVNNGGVLTASTINETYEKILQEYYPGITQAENANVGWIAVSQFYDPYYTKSYAFAVSAACNAADSILSGDKQAIANYISFLKAGDSKTSDELYALVDTDIHTDASFDKPLLDRCNVIIDESEAIINQNTK